MIEMLIDALTIFAAIVVLLVGLGFVALILVAILGAGQ